MLVIIVCSTGFWTLLTRSIIGGIVLTAVAQLVLYGVLVLLVRVVDGMAPEASRLSHDPEVHSGFLRFFAGCGLSYAALMLWLSRRRFALMKSPMTGTVSNQ